MLQLCAVAPGSVKRAYNGERDSANRGKVGDEAEFCKPLSCTLHAFAVTADRVLFVEDLPVQGFVTDLYFRHVTCVELRDSPGNAFLRAADVG